MPRFLMRFSVMSRRGVFIARTAVFAIGALLITLGIQRGELVEIMRKAVIICLECIGIG